MRIAPLVVATLLAVGCSKKSQDGLPPASDWSGGQPGEAVPQQQGAMPNNPHGGDMTAQGDMPPGHPDIGGGGGGQGGGGPDVTKMGFSAPDPNRKIDPNHHVTGTLKVTDKTKALVKAGGAVFLIVKKADASGAPSGPPLAVDRVLYTDGLKFSLTDANAMVAGTELSGDVVITARYDQDSDAISKQPGDVTGQLKVKVPADNIEIALDTVLQ